MLRTCLLCLPLLMATVVWAVEHPALPLNLNASQLSSLKSGLAPLLALPEEDLLKLIPKQSGLYFVGCLNCQSGQQEGQLTVWDWRKPDEVKCRYCGHAYPSEQYPATGVTEAKAPDGSVSRYPYCTVKPQWWQGKDPYQSYFAARADYHKIRFMETAARNFAYAYKLSGDPAYGRRAALILTRFAEVFPGYAFHFDYPFFPKVIIAGRPEKTSTHGEYRSARWTWWAYLDISQSLLEAYDLLATSGELQKLSTERGKDVPAAVESMFTDMVTEVMRNRDDLSNMSPGMWADFIRAGRVLGKPEWVHTAVGRLRRMMTEMFFYDGSWMEGAPSYHSQVIGAAQSVVVVAQGYSDPAGYKHPQTGERFDNLDLATQLPEVARAKEALSRMRLPNGRFVTVHDTWATNGGSARTESKPDLLGGLGQALLGQGQGGDQIQANLTWSPGYGHIHHDGLALQFFARGQELLSDLGYTHTRAREWTIQTLSHNLVVVDHANQAANKDTLGHLRYSATNDAVQVVSVDNPQVYHGVETYRRTLALVKLDGANAYVVDLFRVKGGQQHDYLLHGNADQRQTLAASGPGLQFAPLPTLVPAGVTFQPATNEQTANMKPGQAYGYLTDLRQAPVTTDSIVALDYQDPNGAANLRAYLAARPGDTLVTGDNPAIRGAGSDDSKLDSFRRAFALLRRPGGDSAFAAIMAPYADACPLDAVEVLDLAGTTAAFSVRSGQRLDLVLLGADKVNTQWQGKPLLATADFALVTLQDGDPVAGTVIGGEVTWNGFAVKTQAPQQAPLAAVTREGGKGALLLEGNFAPAPGSVIVLDHGGRRCSPYTVAASTPEGDRVRVQITDDPGFEYDAANQTSKFLFIPRESYTGPHVVRFFPASQVSIRKDAR